jgi:predicted metal-dependent hydrolase
MFAMKIDRIVHSRRRTIALVIETDGSLTVRAPLRASRNLIERLVQEKAAWIQEKQAWVQSHPAAPGHKSFDNGELFYYLGETIPLEIVSHQSPGLQLKDGRFLLDRRSLPRAEKVFTDWYRRQARSLIGARLEIRAAEFGYTYRSLRISSARRRWGSCGATGTLNFSWRLVMAPLPVIDYVILHELVHLEIRNHSPIFWQRISQLMPDYKQRMAWLKANGQQLSL